MCVELKIENGELKMGRRRGSIVWSQLYAMEV